MKYLAVLSIFLLSISTSVSQEFIGSFRLITEQAYANGNTRIDSADYHFGKEKVALHIYARGKPDELRLIFNPSDTTITGLFEINGRKSGYILPMNNDYWPGMPFAQRPYGTGPRTELNYSGRQKEILGYQCREIVAESEEYNVEIWASDIPLSFTKVIAYQTVGAGEQDGEVKLFDTFGVETLPLEIYLKSKIGKGDVHLLISNLHAQVNEDVFSTEGHFLSRPE